MLTHHLIHHFILKVEYVIILITLLKCNVETTYFYAFNPCSTLACVNDYSQAFFCILGEVALFLFCRQFNQPHHGSSFDQVNYVIDIKLAHKVTAVYFDGPYGTVQ